jgi:hypothetical protein
MDLVPRHIEEIIKEFADGLRRIRRVDVPDLCRLIQTSKSWNMGNLREKLERWSVNFSRVSGRNRLVELVSKAFYTCRSDEELTHLRGLLLEAFIIAGHGGSTVLADSKHGWGAMVNLTVEKGTFSIRYECPTPTSQAECEKGLREICKDRSTVDFGYWNGRSAKFYECKAQPAGIGCKEVKYMQTLKQELEAHNVSHEIFFVCADSREAIAMRLSDKGLGPLYKPIGTRELQAMLSA